MSSTRPPAVRARLLLLALALAPAMSPAVAQNLPQHVGKVNDFANILDVSQRAALEAQLADLEHETSAEVALLTLATLGDRNVEEYATELFNAWGIGKKDRDNGVLVLVAVHERVMRIEVGYGLEGILPDGLAGAVIRETFVPRFRGDDYRAGVLDGMARIVEIIRRGETVTAEQRAALNQAARDASMSWGMAALIAPFVGAGAFALGTAAGAQVAVQLIFGLCFTAAAIYLSAFVAPQTAVISLALLAVAVTTTGFVLARRPKWRRYIRGSGQGGGARGWIAEGSGGSSSSSGDSSSGGSGDFGGGSSGGGGATGHW